jgi:hypothetical protein
MIDKHDFPDSIVNAISNVVSQYIMETGTKDRDTIFHFSSFSEYVVSSLEESKLIINELSTCENIDRIYEIAEERKNLFEDNIELYSQLEHLLNTNIPEYVIASIIKSVVYIFNTFDIKNELETKEFYGRFGENLCLDLQTHILIDKKHK